jgi:hypothetical protein
MLDPAATTSCLNCGAALTGPFCARCGQHVTDTDMSLRELLRGTFHELTAVDGKVLRTLKALVLRPGQLTLDALAGRRARWLPPLRIYLICSVVYFVSGPIIERITHRAANARAMFTLTDDEGRPATVLTPSMRQKLAEGLPARVYGIDRLERAARNPTQLGQYVSSSRQQAMFVLLPLFAALTSLAWRKRRLKYPAHLYLALHAHAAWFAIFALLNIVAAFLPLAAAVALGSGAVVWIVFYTLFACRRVFSDSWPGTIGRSLFVATAYSLSWLITSLLLLGLALFTI